MVMETAMVPVYGPHPDDLDATLDDYDEHMREAAERFRAADEKALARYQARREQNVAQIEYAREQLDRPMESRLQAGVERIDKLIAEIEDKLAPTGEIRLDAYGYHPTERAIRNAAERSFAEEEFRRVSRRRAAAPKCGWRKHEERESVMVGSFDGRTIVFDGSETGEQKLDRLFSVAMELNHPGIDAAGVDTMKSYVKGGRFDHEHYIKIWSERLIDMGVEFEGLELPAAGAVAKMSRAILYATPSF